MIRTSLALALLLSAPAAATPPCAGGERAQEFNFWIGEWEVRSQGQIAGTNSIRPILDGCVLQENWRGAQGGAGTSLNFYDPSRNRWRQLWVWRGGTSLELEGGLVDGAMVLSGSTTTPDGRTVENRITWTHAQDGSVRQLWESSTDGGKTWQTSFDGHYTRATTTPASS